jgi:WD40 repeat protein
VWDTAREGPREFASYQSLFGRIAFAPDGEHLLFSSIGFASAALTLSALATGEPVRGFWGEDGEFMSVTFSPDGKLLAAGTQNGRVWLWTVGGRLVHVLNGHQGFVWSLAFAADGKTLATACDDGTARLWEVATGRERARLAGHRSNVFTVAFAPDGKTLATGGTDGRVLLWKLSALGQTVAAP